MINNYLLSSQHYTMINLYWIYRYTGYIDTYTGYIDTYTGYIDNFEVLPITFYHHNTIQWSIQHTGYIDILDILILISFHSTHRNSLKTRLHCERTIQDNGLNKTHDIYIQVPVYWCVYVWNYRYITGILQVCHHYLCFESYEKPIMSPGRQVMKNVQQNLCISGLRIIYHYIQVINICSGNYMVLIEG